MTHFGNLAGIANRKTTSEENQKNRDATKTNAEIAAKATAANAGAQREFLAEQGRLNRENAIAVAQMRKKGKMGGGSGGSGGGGYTPAELDEWNGIIAKLQAGEDLTAAELDRARVLNNKTAAKGDQAGMLEAYTKAQGARAAADATRKNDEGRQAPGVRPQPGVVPSTKQYEEVREAGIVRNKVDKQADALLKAVSSGDVGQLLIEAPALATILQLTVKGKGLGELGALSGPDMDMVRAIVDNPTTAKSLLAQAGGTERLQRQLKNLKAWMKNTHDSVVSGNGFEKDIPKGSVKMRSPKGVVKWVPPEQIDQARKASYEDVTDA
jgi:hypothetical protein